MQGYDNAGSMFLKECGHYEKSYYFTNRSDSHDLFYIATDRC